MTATPTNPNSTANHLRPLMRSPRKRTASAADQMGMVNSMDTTCASGIMVSATNQPYCAT